MRKRRLSANTSDTKSKDQRSEGREVQSAVLCCVWPVCAPFSALHSKPFLPLEPIQLLVVHVYPFALQHQTGPAIAKALPVCRDLVHALSDLLICLLLLAPHRLRIAPDQVADPGLRDLMALQHVQSCGPAFSRTRQPFPNRSFRMELSSIWSARSRFSLARSPAQAP